VEVSGSFTPQPLYPQVKNPRCPLDRTLGGDAWPGLYTVMAKREKQFLPMPGIEPRSCILYLSHRSPKLFLRYEICVPIWTKMTVEVGTVSTTRGTVLGPAQNNFQLCLYSITDVTPPCHIQWLVAPNAWGRGMLAPAKKYFKNNLNQPYFEVHFCTAMWSTIIYTVNIWTCVGVWVGRV
jgi:hypothetical protein